MFDFQPNSMVDASGNAVTGTVDFYATYIDPTDPNFGISMPGGDFYALNAAGEDGVLRSYGVVVAEAEDANGDPVNCSNAPATVSVRIPGSLLASAPATIDMWRLVNSVWEPFTMATRVGSFYEFETSGLGSINCDIFGRRAFVEGTVCDPATGLPLPFVAVRTDQYITFTGFDGSYTLFLPSGRSFDVAPDGQPAQNTGTLQASTVTTLDFCTATGGTGGTGDVKITLEWDAAVDLDLHVIDPCGNMIDYTNKTATCQGFVGELDVDDVNGGPGSVENTFWGFGAAPTGTYSYYVEYFGGSGSASYTLTVIVDGTMMTPITGTLTATGQMSSTASFTR